VRTRRRRPGALKIAVGALLVVAVVGWATTTGWNLGEDASTPVTQPPPRDAVPPVDSDTPSDAAPAAAPPTGVFTKVTVNAFAAQRVTQVVRTDGPVEQILLGRPPSSTGTGPIWVRNLEVEAGGESVYPVTAASSGPIVLPEIVDLGSPAEQVRISYTRSGNVERSETSPTRALVAVTPVPVRLPGPVGGAHEVEVTGGRLLSMTCSEGPEALPRPCGGPTPDGWVAKLTPDQREGPVHAQLDLPSGA